MPLITIARLVVFSFSLLFSLVALGLSAHILSITDTVFAFSIISADYAGLALATSIFTLLALGPCLVIGFIRKGAIVNRIIIEIVILSILWIFWVASAARSSVWNLALQYECRFVSKVDDPDGGALAWCQETAAIEGISFVVWIFIMLYTISLSFYAAMARSRGNANVFNMSVEEASLWSHNSNIPLAYRDKATPQAMQPHSVPAATQV